MFNPADQSLRERPLVTVIIPAYNAESYLGRAIESVINQTLPNIEVIVVDDSSTDKTLRIAQDYAARDSRVKVIASPKNLGAPGARNLAIDAANGEWIAPLDADDWLSPSRFSELLNSAKIFSADMVADDFYFIDHITLEPQATFAERNQTIYKDPLQITPSFYVKQSNKAWGTGIGPGFLKPIIRRSLLEKNGIRYRERVLVGQDFFFYLDCLMAGARFYFRPDPHYYYLVRPGSLCRRDDESRLERFRHYERELAVTLQDERLNADPELKASLAEKLSDCQRKLQYRIVIDAFRRKRYLRAILQSLKNPLFFVHLFQTVSMQKLRSAFS